MSLDILSSGTRKARKPHGCDGFRQVDIRGWNDIVREGGKLPDNVPHRIEPGMSYFYQKSVMDGEIGEFKSCQHCWKTINDFRLFDEDY